jgi:nitrate/nitrite transporter NarK
MQIWWVNCLSYSGPDIAAVQRVHESPPLPAAAIDILAALVLMALICIGSRGLCVVDSVLIGCGVGSVFALAPVIFRYAPHEMHGLATGALA